MAYEIYAIDSEYTMRSTNFFSYIKCGDYSGKHTEVIHLGRENTLEASKKRALAYAKMIPPTNYIHYDFVLLQNNEIVYVLREDEIVAVDYLPGARGVQPSAKKDPLVSW